MTNRSCKGEVALSADKLRGLGDLSHLGLRVEAFQKDVCHG
jgi:hypothetical protein